MAISTIIPEARVRPRDRTRGKEAFRSSLLIIKDGDDPSDYGSGAGKYTGEPPQMYSAIVGKIALVLLRDLLLRASRLIHAGLVTKERHEGVPGCHKNQQI